MSVSDPIADMLTKIRNACMAGKETVEVPFSGIKLEIVKILKHEGYIDSYGKTDEGILVLQLKYDEAEEPVIHGLKRLSKTGRRQYSGYKDMPRIFNGYGTLIVSTSKGVVTGRSAAQNKTGGELLCSVW